MSRQHTSAAQEFQSLRLLVYAGAACFLVVVLSAGLTARQTEPLELGLYIALCILLPGLAFLLAHSRAGVAMQRRPMVLVGITLAVGAAAMAAAFVYDSAALMPLLFVIPASAAIYLSGPPSLSDFLDACCWNLLCLAATFSFLAPLLDTPWLPVWMAIGATLAYVALANPAAMRYSRLPPLPVRMPSHYLWAGIAIASISLFLARQNYFDYPHWSYYIGPAFDVHQGKSLLWDTPSIYGYLNAHFMSWLAWPIGLDIPSYYYLHLTLAVFWLLVCGAIILCATGNMLARLCAVGFVVAFAANSTMDPLTGPLRFGLHALVLFACIRLHGRKRIAACSVLAALSIWWAVDTALQVALPWVITCLVAAIAEKGLRPGAILSTAKKAGPFLCAALSITAAVMAMEYDMSRGFAPLDSYLLSTLVRGSEEASVASLFPAFGSHLGAAFLCILSLCLLAHMTATARPHRLFDALCFSTFSLILMLLRMVNLSHSTYLLFFGIPLVLHLTLLGVVLVERYAVSAMCRRRYFAMSFGPLVLVSAALFLQSYAVPEQLPVAGAIQARSPYTLAHPPEKDSFLRQLQQRFGHSGPIAVLSPHDTKLCVEAGIPNALPLNPFNTPALVLHFEEHFLGPAVQGLAPGTMLVAAVETNYAPLGMQHKPWQQPWWEIILQEHRVEFLGEAVDQHPLPAWSTHPQKGVAYQVFRISASSGNFAGLSHRQRLEEQILATPMLLAAFVAFDNLVVKESAGDRRQTWQALVTRLPTSANAKVLLARTLLEEEQPEEAATLLHQALETEPDHRLALRMMANVQVLLGNCNDAIEKLDALAALPEPHFFSVAALQLTRIRALDACGDEAAADAERALWLEQQGSDPSNTMQDLPLY